MGSSDHNHRDFTKLGQDFRIAIACMGAAQRFKSVKSANPESSNTEPGPVTGPDTLARQLRTLSAEIDTHRARLLEMLVCFDEQLSWSKVRLLVKVADEDNERQLADVAVDATVADVDRICRELRWKKLEQGDDGAEQTGEHRSAEDIAA